MLNNPDAHEPLNVTNHHPGPDRNGITNSLTSGFIKQQQIARFRPTAKGNGLKRSRSGHATVNMAYTMTRRLQLFHHNRGMYT